MTQKTLDDFLFDVLGDGEEEIDTLKADVLMLHDWLVERDLPGPQGHWDSEDDGTPWIAEPCPPDATAIVKSFINTISTHFDEEYTPSSEDTDSRVEFEWDLANRRILIKPQTYVEEDCSTENVGLYKNEAIALNDLLLLHHIESVGINFDGSGDSGDMQVEDYSFYDGHDTDQDLEIEDELIAIAESAVQFDWVNNSGGHGTITFSSERDKPEASISFDAYYRETNLVDDEYNTIAITY